MEIRERAIVQPGLIAQRVGDLPMRDPRGITARYSQGIGQDQLALTRLKHEAPFISASLIGARGSQIAG